MYDEFPKWVVPDKSWVAEHPGSKTPHVYDYQYDVSRDGDLRVLVHNATEEAKVASPKPAPKPTVKVTTFGPKWPA